MSCLMAVYITGFPIGEITNAKYPGRDFFLKLFLEMCCKMCYMNIFQNNLIVNIREEYLTVNE